MSDRPFELRVEPDKAGGYALALYRRSAQGGQSGDSESSWQRVVRIRGTSMHAVMDQVLSTIRKAGYRTSDLARSRKTPFQLAEPAGVRLGLLMLAVKPLRKTSRMAEISQQIQAMAEEEAYYWFSKSTDNGIGRRCQKALRILLAKE